MKLLQEHRSRESTHSDSTHPKCLEVRLGESGRPRDQYWYCFARPELGDLDHVERVWGLQKELESQGEHAQGSSVIVSWERIDHLVDDHVLSVQQDLRSS